MSSTTSKQYQQMLDEARRVERRVVGQAFRDQQADVQEQASEISAVFNQGLKPLLTTDFNAAVREMDRARPLGQLRSGGERLRVTKLERLLNGSRAAVEALDEALGKVAVLQAKLRVGAGNAKGRPKLTVTEGQLSAESATVAADNSGLNPLDTSLKTSAGCECASECGREQGMPFTWCRVNPGKSCGLLSGGSGSVDPTGFDHRLYLRDDAVGGGVYPVDTGPTATTHFWDYCAVPKPQDKVSTAVIAPPKVVRTAHPGCTCVSESTNLKTGETTSIGKKMGYWRDFFTKKYETYVGKKDFLRDPPTGAEAWVKKLPLKDRFAALFAGQYQPGDKPPAPTRLPSAGEQICRTIPGMTNGFAVCPVEMSCLDGKGQESDRFLGRNRWTWDYCAMDGWGGHQWGLPQPDVAIAPTGM
mmetsp:Transcript_27489/g.69329  ORF Transcript_27489/g.69329 Transcript_27489/m.69329 type:complete len:416 (-) Transcript_27489:257-1504(-)|eukprot:CAMPEP_0178986798 /NCGR_PEP_ID=MMETSP0795-20121207/2904_1 /TAXON_ID=88552 /ORGANISM="Amoebophrya sp., Strain Ameob2" /LENGTH=415 /DNA_ID=CAMNT_0020677899 /DNA_START=333 /DNA_END=1580 /DNA_ORIENTATION=+